MKKITLLFATMLAMSEMSFGQKESKLLWETKLNSVSQVNYLSQAFCRKVGEESTLAYNSYGVHAIDKNGGIVWKFPSIGVFGKNNFLALKEDTLYRIDKDLRFNTTPKIPFSRNLSFPLEVEDGYIVRDINANEIIKWDYNAKEMWRYKFDSSIDLRYVTFSETASGYTLSYSLLGQGKEPSRLSSLKLDKNGKQTELINKKITPLYQFGTLPVLTADKGVWLHESPFGSLGTSIMVRLDSDNKEILKFDTNSLLKIIDRTDAFPIFKSARGYYDLPLGITPNGSLIYGFYTVDNDKKPKSFFFAKIDGVSKPILTDEMSIENKSIKDLPSYLKFIGEDNFIFSSAKKIGRIIGNANFKTRNSIWYKKTDFSIGAEDGNTYETILTSKDNSLSVIRNDSLICYTIDGKVKWSKANVNQYNYLGKEEYGTESISYLFAIKDSLTTKIRISDGKELWTLKLNHSKIISEDLEGNTFMYREVLGYSPFSRQYYIDFISKTGTILSVYKSTKADFNQVGAPFYDYNDVGRYLIDSKNNFFYSHSLEKQSDETYQFIYRKYSTRCLYDIEATAEATGKTEVCSGTKVKLSTSKQDGLTYQWQKDGKDIPAFRDIVHDVEESGNYTVTVKDESCQNQTISNPIKVTIKPTPEAVISTDTKGVVYEPFTVKMSANSGTGLAYQWLKDEVIIPDETKINYEAKKSGKYKVNVTYDGCTKTSDALTISILIPLANQEEVGEEQVQIYPNPNKGEFKIILPKSLKSADVQLFDTFGRERSLMYVGEQAQAEGLGQGVYFLRVQKGEKAVTSKLIIE